MARGCHRRHGRSAHGKLVLAQLILFFIGLLSIFVSAFAIRDAHEEVVEILVGVPAQVEPGSTSGVLEAQEQFRLELTRRFRIAAGIDLGVGMIFVGCALLVHRFPVTSTVTGLALYVGTLVAVAIIEPRLLTQGFVLRILVIVSLSVAARSAIRSKRRRSRHSRRETEMDESAAR